MTSVMIESCIDLHSESNWIENGGILIQNWEIIFYHLRFYVCLIHQWLQITCTLAICFVFLMGLFNPLKTSPEYTQDNVYGKCVLLQN